MTSDEQEALSYSYAVKQNIVRLKSGNYAVFERYNYSNGSMPIAHIGPWHECEPFITEYVPPVRMAKPLPVSLLDLGMDLDL